MISKLIEYSLKKFLHKLNVYSHRFRDTAVPRFDNGSRDIIRHIRTLDHKTLLDVQDVF